MKTFTVKELEALLPKKARRGIMAIGGDIVDLNDDDYQRVHELDRDEMIQLRNDLIEKAEQLHARAHQIAWYMLHRPADWDALRRSLS